MVFIEDLGMKASFFKELSCFFIFMIKILLHHISTTVLPSF
ncbi:hypothetical protein CBB_1838 [Clostridium botulinum Bf]|uniref:Uncharacterized protein n=1 Tax=Clostridium botulinum (strain 657 / Type Ba4) TaxID=515621 RepID=A0A3F3A5W5_CLOB6|nr:hypothetical protein CLJ_B1625 [Clostridium botulinum Ba4 str. 657]EDT86413.1 hypothetical protein CBB_1838 [Clostridium botulinum Bf]